MPYDHRHGAANEFAFLLAELQTRFPADDPARPRRPSKFSPEAISSRSLGIVLTRAPLASPSTTTTSSMPPSPLRATGTRTGATASSASRPPTRSPTSPRVPHASDLLLLKLHGSVNWWPRLGYPKPFALDAIVHHHGWEGISRRLFPPEVVARHLDSEPVIVPPVLSKSDLVAQPVLRLVWTLAYEHLSTADAVTFIGYSLPTTDTAARVLFAESLADLPLDAVTVVGFETDDIGAEAFED